MKMAISGGGPGAPQTTDSSGNPAGNVVLPDGLGSLISGEDQTNDVLVVEQGRYGFVRKTTTALQTIGSAPGDYLHSIIIDVGDLTGTVTVQDGSNVLFVLPIGTVAPMVIPIGIVAVTNIRCSKTEAADRLCLIGRFT